MFVINNPVDPISLLCCWIAPRPTPNCFNNSFNEIVAWVFSVEPGCVEPGCLHHVVEAGMPVPAKTVPATNQPKRDHYV